jgi:exopolysaccharide biosynthesis protein
MHNIPYLRRPSQNQRRDSRMIWLVLALAVLLIAVLIAISQQGASSARPRINDAPLAAQALPGSAAHLAEAQATAVPTPQPAVTAAPAPTPVPTPEPTPCFPLAALCFEGHADYRYFDERLAIQIRQHTTDELAYFVCDIQTTDPGALRTALSGEKVYGDYEHTSDIAKRHGAVLAINGDDYGVHRYGVIIRDHALIRAKKTTRHMLTLDAAGDFEIVTDRTSETAKELGDRLLVKVIRETWEFGPELVRDGQATSFSSAFDLISVKDKTLEPRTGIGQIGPLHYVVIVVDGRREGYSRGISLSGLQQLFVNAGARTAFNLDGGGSATLYFRGQVLNRPSGGEQRSVSDILYF